jgi:hypothetical protein
VDVGAFQGTAPRAVGTVGQLTGTCPAVTFVLSGTTVHTSDKTVFEVGTCADLKDGVRAGAMGPKRLDGSIDAERIRVAGTPPAPGPRPEPPPHVGGIVASLTGACPALTFVLSGTTVRTTASTVFEGGTCADLKDGMRAGAAGPKGTDGAIEARHVRMANAPGPRPNPGPPPLMGTVGSLTGACPALTFVLSGTTVHTTDKTVFGPGACSDVKEGKPAGAIGPKRADGSIDAEHVRVRPVV